MSIEKWLKAYNEPKPRPKQKNAIRGIDRYDREDLAAMRKQIRQYRVARDKLLEIATDTGGGLTDDSTMSFYKVQPELTATEDMDPRYVINRAVAEALQGTPEWERLRSWTSGDMVNTAMSFVDVEPILEQLFDRTSKELQQKAEAVEQLRDQLEQLQQQQKNLDELIEQWQQGGIFDPEGDEVQGGQEAAAGLAGQIADLEAEIEAGQGDVDKQAEKAVKGAMPALRQAMGESADKAEETAAAVRGFGMEPGQLQRMPANERIKLAQRLDKNERFKRLAKLIGPMMRLAEAEQTRKVYHSFEEVYDIETGNNLARLVPSEMLDLMRPATKLHFYQRWVEGKLLQYAMRGTEKVGKGGIIVCMDNSGSMAGDKEIWAKAVGLATLAVAREQKRSFFGLHFGSRNELEKFDFTDPAAASLDQVMDYAEFFFNGGTDFVRPLTEALSLLQAEEKAKGFVEGDILFLTDGICSVPPAWLEEFIAERTRLNFKVWAILIGGVGRTAEPLNTIADGNVVTIQDLLTGEEVRNMFRQL